MSDDAELLMRRRACWDTGEEAAREAFGWIVEDTHPSAIPTDGPGIEKLVQDLTPKAMERVAPRSPRRGRATRRLRSRKTTKRSWRARFRWR
jgi:hypothetical protein